MKSKIIKDYLDPDLPIKNQLFRVITNVTLLTLALITFISILMRESMADIMTLACAFFVFLAISYFSIKKDKITFGANLIALIIIFVVLPMSFFTGGGVKGGTPIWFVFCFVYICLVVSGKTKVVMIAAATVVVVLSYALSYFVPELVTKHSEHITYFDSLASVLLVSITVSILVSFQAYLYGRQYEITKKQKKEIEELVQAQNHFFSSMSHEIRTPVNSIIGLDEMILREENLPDEVVEDAMGISSSGKMLLTLINDILDMSKIEAGNMEIVSSEYYVGEMLSELVNMHWSLAEEKGLALHVNVDETVPAKLRGDEIRIKQVLTNVLTNAIKYTREGSVTLSIQSEESENGQIIMCYSIEDTGIGIKNENIPYLFTAFKRVDQEENRYIEGTGLGLSIVKSFVDLMGGEITVDSIYTKGSVFLIKIPQAKVDEDQIGQIQIETKHAIGKREHYRKTFDAPLANILVADDNETNLLVTKKLLRDTGITIDTVSNGEEALGKCIRKKYDIIFMDHFMPEMDGITALHRIRNQKEGMNIDTPVIVLTANAGSDLQKMYRAEGFDDYLLKPVSGKALEEMVLRYLPADYIHPVDDSEDNTDIVSTVGTIRKKMPIMITTDSVCDLPEKMLAKTEILINNYHIITEKGEFLDGVETEAEGVLSYITTSGKNARSIAPDREGYEKFFADALTRAQQIIHITMSEGIGNGYNNAMEAASSFDNVKVIESGSLSTGLGLLVLYADRMITAGLQGDELINAIEKAKGKLVSDFIVGDTRFLAKGGQISKSIDSICRAFMLHPVLTCDSSGMKPRKIMAGRRERSWDKYITGAIEKINPKETDMVFITYAGLSYKEISEIRERLIKYIPARKVMVQKASPAIAVNCGPGSFGILYMKK
ncbi:MAG: DegV family EDD domain-containing protein [Lachnospiraceae bacterium]|nr:DegV family EDD domain-containing protein [Lachnospiraceae bacterium]